MNMKKSMLFLSGLTLAASLCVSPALADSAAVTAEKSANVRSGAGMNHPVISWAMKGDSVETLGASGNWTKVRLASGKEGYIHSSMLSSGAGSAPSVGGSAAVSAEKSANVRSEANMSGKVIGWAMKGDAVTVLESGAKWSRVRLANGTVGYIHNSMLTGVSSAPSAGASATVIAEKSANVRSEANMSGKVIGWVMKGDTVTVLHKGTKWSKVQLAGGTIGYVHNSMLK